MTDFICTKCDICINNNYRPMLGDGNLDANIMFITRNPSAYEVRNNVPMVSKDGMLFQRYLELFNFDRNHIFITNAVKCKTPSHRYPTDVELDHCRPYLENEIKHVNPKIIVLVGFTAMRAYFKLMFTSFNINIDTLNSKYMIHNGRVILFMISPAHAINSRPNRVNIYNAFISLLQLYRCIDPAHRTNINL